MDLSYLIDFTPIVILKIHYWKKKKSYGESHPCLDLLLSTVIHTLDSSKLYDRIMIFNERLASVLFFCVVCCFLAVVEPNPDVFAFLTTA